LKNGEVVTPPQSLPGGFRLDACGADVTLETTTSDMATFPRTTVGGVSVSRMIVGTNWFLGWSHTSLAKDKFIKSYQTRESIAQVICTFLEYGIDTVMGPTSPLLIDAVRLAEDRSGKKVICVLTPGFSLAPDCAKEESPEAAFDFCQKHGATFCLPHQCVTYALIDRRAGTIRDLDRYTAMIRERGMIPGLSTHMPEAIVYADKQNADVETYIQLYNSAGFLMQVEVDWVMKVIQEAKKPVMTIKPLAAGKILPPVGLAFVWATLRDCDMVTIGTTTSDEAREVAELSLGFLERRAPGITLQETRSKKSLKK
jgi:hypothetical protein